MTVKELKKTLNNFDDNMDVCILDKYGYIVKIRCIVMQTTEDFDIPNNRIIFSEEF